MDPQPTGIWRWLLVGAYAVAVSAFALVFTVGVPAILLLRALDAGLTVSGILSGAIAAVWLAVLVLALVTDREARGWIVFLLLGWILALPAAARRLVALVRR